MAFGADNSGSGSPAVAAALDLPGGGLIDELPRGYYFVPTDGEILIYLKKKIMGEPLPCDIIPTVDNVYGVAPDSLPFESSMYTRGNEWFFFTIRTNSNEVMSEDGYWTTTPTAGAGGVVGLEAAAGDDEIIRNANGEVEGFKKELVYYDGVLGGNAETTCWRILEYRINPYAINNGSPNQLSDDVKHKIANLVICKVFVKKMRACRRRRGTRRG